MGTIVNKDKNKDSGNNRKKEYDENLHRLKYAVKKGDYECVKRILETGTIIKSGILHDSLLTNNLAVLELLIEFGANVNDKNEDKRIIDVALLKGKFRHAQVLISKGAEIDINMFHQLNKKHLKVGMNLFYQYIDVRDWDNDGSSILHLAVRYDDWEGAELVLKRGASVDEKTLNNGCTALHLASEIGSIYCVDVLLRHGAKPNLKDKLGFTPFHKAASLFKRYNEIVVNNQLLILRMLLEEGANINDVNEKGTTPLFLAAADVNVECIKFLIESGAIVNVKADDCKSTPLFTLIQNSKVPEKRLVQAMKLLLDAGANVNEKCKDGCTALHIAVKNTRPLACELLLQYGANPNLKDNNRYTPLHILADIKTSKIYIFTQIRMINLLLSAGSNVNEIASNGFTPVHCAMQAGADGVIRAIIEHISIQKISRWYREELTVGFTSNTLQILIENGNWMYHYICCDVELEQMRLHRIHESMTLFDFLAQDDDRIYSIASTVEELFENPKCHTCYPIYYKHLKRKFYAIVQQITRKNKMILNLTEIIRSKNNSQHLTERESVDLLNTKDVKNERQRMWKRKKISYLNNVHKSKLNDQHFVARKIIDLLSSNNVKNFMTAIESVYKTSYWGDSMEKESYL